MPQSMGIVFIDTEVQTELSSVTWTGHPQCAGRSGIGQLTETTTTSGTNERSTWPERAADPHTETWM